MPKGTAVKTQSVILVPKRVAKMLGQFLRYHSAGLPRKRVSKQNPERSEGSTTWSCALSSLPLGVPIDLIVWRRIFDEAVYIKASQLKSHTFPIRDS